MLVNKDLTRESVHLYISNHQIYAKIWSRSRNKWCTQTYFQSYDWEIDDSLIESTIRYIIRVWRLNNPRIVIEQ